MACTFARFVQLKIEKTQISAGNAARGEALRIISAKKTAETAVRVVLVAFVIRIAFA